MNVCTINARSLLSDAQLIELEEEARQIKFDVIGLAEVRRKGNGAVSRPNGNYFYFSGSNTHPQGGVGFYVTSKWLKRVVSFKCVSPRIAQLKLKISARTNLRIIQVHAPHSGYDDAAYTDFLDKLTDVLNGDKSTFTVVMGDFNAVVGKRKPGEYSVGNFGYGARNNRGQAVVDFCENNSLKIISTFFKKRKGKKWTWRSPNGATRNEIDLVLGSKQTITRNIDVLNHFKTGSDHRLVRCKIELRDSRLWARRRTISGRTMINKALYSAAIRSNGLNQAESYESVIKLVKMAMDMSTEFEEPRPVLSSSVTDL
ncbi:hypothetical protein AB6A40_007261, partial [Gnathostoma spinigerum]